MPAKKRLVAKNKSAEYVLEQIKSSSVFGKSKKYHVEGQQEHKFSKPESYRSDAGKPRVPSKDSYVGTTAKQEKQDYTGDLKLGVGPAFNKGGLQVLLEGEEKMSGKKTVQLGD